jgi:23S rRNA (guanosine2251-2'-O)-methyltransferase
MKPRFGPPRRPRPFPPEDEIEATGRLVLGVQPVREVLRAHGERTVRVLLEGGDSPKLEGLARLATGRGVPIERVSRAALDRLAKGAMHQGAAAFAPRLQVLSEEELLAALGQIERPLILILDGIMDPQNFGAVVRSAVALGASFVVWAEHGSAPLTPATFRASAGAIEHARLARVPSLPTVLEALSGLGFTSVLLEGSSEGVLGDLDLTGPLAIVVGAEDRGAKPAVRRAVTHRAKLPMSGTIDSLNASVAGALALYEALRQRSVSNSTT